MTNKNQATKKEKKSKLINVPEEALGLCLRAFFSKMGFRVASEVPFRFGGHEYRADMVLRLENNDDVGDAVVEIKTKHTSSIIRKLALWRTVSSAQIYSFISNESIDKLREKHKILIDSGIWIIAIRQNGKELTPEPLTDPIWGKKLRRLPVSEDRFQLELSGTKGLDPGNNMYTSHLKIAKLIGSDRISIGDLKESANLSDKELVKLCVETTKGFFRGYAIIDENNNMILECRHPDIANAYGYLYYIDYLEKVARTGDWEHYEDINNDFESKYNNINWPNPSEKVELELPWKVIDTRSFDSYKTFGNTILSSLDSYYIVRRGKSLLESREETIASINSSFDFDLSYSNSKTVEYIVKNSINLPMTPDFMQFLPTFVLIKLLSASQIPEEYMNVFSKINSSYIRSFVFGHPSISDEKRIQMIPSMGNELYYGCAYLFSWRDKIPSELSKEIIRTGIIRGDYPHSEKIVYQDISWEDVIKAVL